MQLMKVAARLPITVLRAITGGLTVCLELVDNIEKLELFFTTHKAMLKNKTAIFTEVEFWSFDA
jgi:PII-like signaling protein